MMLAPTEKVSKPVTPSIAGGGEDTAKRQQGQGNLVQQN